LLSHADRVIELEDGNVVRDRRASDSNTTNNAKDNEHA
jgi:hypothetical protein